MPLHGKIVVIKRSGGDGTEFPLTATCLFGRKPDCDIRIQLPQVSKEHCRIDLNENKEIILTNLSSVNPTRVNGEVLQQSERLKHGDVITIIDRSFRFEYPPAPTPKKRSSKGGKSETFKVLQDQQLGDPVTTEGREKRISDVSKDPHLKDGTNYDKSQPSLEKSVELETMDDDGLPQDKAASPFNDLYQMIKQSLDVKTPRKSSTSLLQTPSSKFFTPKSVSVKRNGGNPVTSTEDKMAPHQDEAKIPPQADETAPESVKKQSMSFQVPSTETTTTAPESAVTAEATSAQKTKPATPLKLTTCEVIEQVSAQTPKMTMRRRSKEVTPTEPAVTNQQAETSSVKTKRNSGKVVKVIATSKKRKSMELGADLSTSKMKRKRVSFGGHLTPELFDKRLPPNSPLQKGGTPRRSLCLLRPKQSLLRRASAIGLLQEYPYGPNRPSPSKRRSPSPKKSPSGKKASPKAATSAKKSPKSRSPSPKAASPAKKSPKSRSPSPKASTPAKKSPKSRSPSPKAAAPAKKSPKSRSPSPKAATPAKKSPKSRSPSPKAAAPAKKSPNTSLASKSPKVKTSFVKATSPATKSPKPTSSSPVRGRSLSRSKAETLATEGLAPVQTPTVRGRFSVSLIKTPSPVTEVTVTDQVPLVTVTPKLALRRMSMKRSSRKTPSVLKSAVKVMCRRSGISRGSMKALSSWANIVKFGQTKPQVAAPAKTTVSKKTAKKTVPKPKTPARIPKGHMSTGHADSPVTIVVGRACQQNVVHPTGAAPRLVTNTAVLKKNMKMDENLTGISEIFKTPVTERKRRSLNNTSAMKTPQGTSVVEPSVLKTPEEPGEMVVSPLIVSSAVRGGRYNSEAVQRLLDADQECSFFRDVSPATDTLSDSAQQQGTDLKTTSAQTPGQKPEAPDCLTGVKRIMRTPKQKPEQQECLTAVKRIMKTPRQKAEPVEDLRGNLLKTPRQKVEQQECLSGVKRILETPHQEDKPLDNLEGELVEAPEAADASCAVVEAMMETSTCAQESEGPSETTDMKTPNTTSSPAERLTAVKRLVKTPKDKNAPVEETVGVKRLVKTPRETIEPVEENFGNEILVKTPILKDNASEEDFEGPQELMEEPLSEPTGQLDPNEQLEDETTPDCGGDVVKELEFAPEEQQYEAPSDVAEEVPPVSAEEKAGTNDVCTEELSEEAPSDAVQSSDTVETVSQAVEQDLPVEDNKDEAVDVNLSEDPEVDVVEEAASEEQTKMEDSTSRATQIDSTAEEVEQEKKPVRRGRAKTLESKSAEDKQQAEELSEDRVPSPVRGKRGRRIEAAAPPTPRQSRNKNAKTAESSDADLSVQKNASLTEETPQGDLAEEAEENIVSSPVQLEVLPSESDENKTVAMETSSQAPQIESLPEVETSTCKVTESAEAATQKKSVRGRKVTVVESKPAEDKEEVRELSEDPVPAPVRGRRGKKSEVATLPPVRHTTRNRRAKPEKSTSNEQPQMVAERAAETSRETEKNTEAVIDQTSPVTTHQEEHHSAPPTNEAVIKPTRGRKTKTPVHPPQSEPEKNGDVRDEHLMEEAPPQQSTPAPGKPRRGRKPQADIVGQKEVAEDAAVIVETMQQPPPPVRAKRGRNAKLEEVKPENDEKTQSKELVKTPRRTRKTEQDHVEPQEVQAIEATELVVSEEAEVPLVAVPEKVNEKAPAAVRPTRGRKEKTYPENGTPAQSTELQEVPAASSTVKARRGKRGKQVDDEIEVFVLPEENPDHNLEAGEKSEEPDAAVIKPKRGRKGKLVANEVAVVVPEEKHDHNLEEEEKSEEPDAPVIKPSRRVARNGAALAVPAKKTRRGPAPPPEETDEESTVLASKPVSASVETAKKGRRAAAKTAADDTMETSEQANPTDQSTAAVIEDAKKSNRFVKWKNDVEVIEIAKETPVKAVRGRKSKLGDKVDTKSKNESKDAGKTEEKVLSDKVEEAPPTKRARRGVKVADVSAESTSQEKSVEAETLPRTRRGRSAKQ